VSYSLDWGGTNTMAETERTRRLREAESRLLELRRYL
jgi:hypothetical protein